MSIAYNGNRKKAIGWLTDVLWGSFTEPEQYHYGPIILPLASLVASDTLLPLPP